MPDSLNILQPFLYWMITLLYFEMALRLATHSGFNLSGLAYTFTFTLVYTSGIYLVSAPFGGSAQSALELLVMAVLVLMFASQLVYFKIFKMFFTFYSMGNAGQVLEFLKDIFANIALNFHWIMVMLLPLGVQIAVGHTWTQVQSPYLPLSTSLLTLALLTFSGCKSMIHKSKNEVGSAYDIYFRSMDPTVTFRNFGLVTTMRLDFQRSVLGMKSAIYDNIRQPDIEKINVFDAISESKEVSTKMNLTAVNQLPIDFDGLIARTPDPALKEMHAYFRDMKPSAKNAFTGLYKGYNLILITAESMSPFSVHPDLTPTLYKMVHEGCHFKNFYNPIWGVSTSDGEYVACTGLLPKSGVWSFIESAGNDMAMTMGNQLKPLGYHTVAYHNHTYNYYRRHLSHPNMGYAYQGLGSGLDVTPTWPESDVEMMALSVPRYVGKEPFHAYYMTVSGHMRYSFGSNAMAAKHRETVAGLPYSDEAQAYLATQVELDQAMASLLAQLEAAGVAERTLIAMSADHYPYGLSDKALDELAGHKVERNFELYQSPWILYNPGQTPLVIEAPCSSLDMIPTLSNLLGLDFDSRLLMGRDVFSDGEPLVMFLNKSFITSKGRYDAVKREFVPAEGVEPLQDPGMYVRRLTKVIEDKFHYSAKILDKDYYRLLK